MSKKRLMVLVAAAFLFTNLVIIPMFDNTEEEVLTEENLPEVNMDDEVKSSVTGTYDNTPVSLGFQGSEIVNSGVVEDGTAGEELVTRPPENLPENLAVSIQVAENSSATRDTLSSTDRDKYLSEVLEPSANENLANETFDSNAVKDEGFNEATTFIPPAPILTAVVPQVVATPVIQQGVIEEIHIYYASNININHTTEELVIRVKGDSPIKARTLYVGNPERAILDLEGRWEMAEIPPYPVTKYSTALRTGFVDTYTRFVIDITTENFTRKLVQVDPNTVELRVTFEALPTE